jgi:hypothetical protein
MSIRNTGLSIVVLAVLLTARLQMPLQHTDIEKALLAAHYQLYGKVWVKKAAPMTGLVLL